MLPFPVAEELVEPVLFIDSASAMKLLSKFGLEIIFASPPLELAISFIWLVAAEPELAE